MGIGNRDRPVPLPVYPVGVVHCHIPKAPHIGVVAIDKLAYGPGPAGLHAGDQVEWVNHDIFQHSVTGKGFDLDLKPGQKGRLVVSGAGVVDYVCRYHPNMKGQIRIEK